MTTKRGLLSIHSPRRHMPDDLHIMVVVEVHQVGDGRAENHSQELDGEVEPAEELRDPLAQEELVEEQPGYRDRGETQGHWVRLAQPEKHSPIKLRKKSLFNKVLSSINASNRQNGRGLFLPLKNKQRSLLLQFFLENRENGHGLTFKS